MNNEKDSNQNQPYCKEINTINKMRNKKYNQLKRLDYLHKVKNIQN